LRPQHFCLEDERAGSGILIGLRLGLIQCPLQAKGYVLGGLLQALFEIGVDVVIGEIVVGRKASDTLFVDLWGRRARSKTGRRRAAAALGA